MTRPGNLTPAETAALSAVTAAFPHLAQLRPHISAFADIMTSRACSTSASGNGSPPPRPAASPSCSPSPPASATTTLAVISCLTLPYSSGKVEGTVVLPISR